ncbi:TPA: DUF1642 domain-containing protein [Enterococcus faecium]|nr:DUF1642 domain-containing protein [Enterococcus faecium]
MNKQEINEKLKENGAWCTECHTGVTDRYVKIRKAMELVGQLDEPQKPVIDSFVAEYLNYCMANEWTLAEALDTRNVPIPSNMHKTVDWLFSSMNQNIFAQAWLFGYEVEKEPLYRVKIGEGYFVEYQGRGALIMPDCNKEIKIFDSKTDAERTAQTIGGTVEEVAKR